MDLGGFGWIWMDLDGYGLIWIWIYAYMHMDIWIYGYMDVYVRWLGLAGGERATPPHPIIYEDEGPSPSNSPSI